MPKEVIAQFYCPKGSEFDSNLWYKTQKACDAEGFEQPTVVVTMKLILMYVNELTPTEL